jgi:gas vesicle protein
MAEENKFLRGLVIGALTGGIVGAAIALLYAPKSGKELRADLRQKADDVLEGAEEYMTAAQKKAGEIVTEAKKRSDHLVTDAKKKADTLLQDAERVISDAKHKAGTVVEETSRLKDAVKAGVQTFNNERRRS